MDEKKIEYEVLSKTHEAPDVWTLKLKTKEIPSFKYVSGQYINIYFPELGTPEGKAYSFSSSPNEELLSITVKKMGEFSSRLVSLKEGDKFLASLPYGYFYSESKESKLVLIAAGIGVSPFRSIIIEALSKNPLRNIHLLLSSRTVDEIIFRKEFDLLALKHPNFKVKYFITRENNLPVGMTGHRVDGLTVLKNVRDKKGVEFMICGSISFTRDIWRGLKDAGVSEDMIYTEAFFSH